MIHSREKFFGFSAEELRRMADHLSEYELQRLKTIRKNQQKLAFLGLSKDFLSGRRPKQESKSKTSSRKQRPISEPIVAPRQSERLANKPVLFYQLPPDYDDDKIKPPDYSQLPEPTLPPIPSVPASASIVPAPVRRAPPPKALVLDETSQYGSMPGFYLFGFVPEQLCATLYSKFREEYLNYLCLGNNFVDLFEKAIKALVMVFQKRAEQTMDKVAKKRIKGMIEDIRDMQEGGDGPLVPSKIQFYFMHKYGRGEGNVTLTHLQSSICKCIYDEHVLNFKPRYKLINTETNTSQSVEKTIWKFPYILCPICSKNIKMQKSQLDCADDWKKSQLARVNDWKNFKRHKYPNTRTDCDWALRLLDERGELKDGLPNYDDVQYLLHPRHDLHIAQILAAATNEAYVWDADNQNLHFAEKVWIQAVWIQAKETM